MMVRVVAPVDQLYAAKSPASSVTLPPGHTDAGPVIVTTGGACSVTSVGAEVPLHAPLPTVTLYLPAVLTTSVCAVSPTMGFPPNSHWYELPAVAVRVTRVPGQKDAETAGEIDGVNEPTVTLADPVELHPSAETLMLRVTGPVAPAEKSMLLVD